MRDGATTSAALVTHPRGVTSEDTGALQLMLSRRLLGGGMPPLGMSDPLNDTVPLVDHMLWQVQPHGADDRGSGGGGSRVAAEAVLWARQARLEQPIELLALVDSGSESSKRGERSGGSGSVGPAAVGLAAPLPAGARLDALSPLPWGQAGGVDVGAAGLTSAALLRLTPVPPSSPAALSVSVAGLLNPRLGLPAVATAQPWKLSLMATAGKAGSGPLPPCAPDAGALAACVGAGRSATVVLGLEQ